MELSGAQAAWLAREAAMRAAADLASIFAFTGRATTRPHSPTPMLPRALPGTVFRALVAGRLAPSPQERLPPPVWMWLASTDGASCSRCHGVFAPNIRARSAWLCLTKDLRLNSVRLRKRERHPGARHKHVVHVAASEEREGAGASALVEETHLVLNAGGNTTHVDGGADVRGTKRLLEPTKARTTASGVEQNESTNLEGKFKYSRRIKPRKDAVNKFYGAKETQAYLPPRSLQLRRARGLGDAQGLLIVYPVVIVTSHGSLCRVESGGEGGITVDASVGGCTRDWAPCLDLGVAFITPIYDMAAGWGPDFGWGSAGSSRSGCNGEASSGKMRGEGGGGQGCWLADSPSAMSGLVRGRVFYIVVTIVFGRGGSTELRSHVESGGFEQKSDHGHVPVKFEVDSGIQEQEVKTPSRYMKGETQKKWRLSGGEGNVGYVTPVPDR
ncbi:hypothetical protein C8F04DRAFT_1189366 [Mycena alexandri]|uniref:Uncharacterized protein n=1 Tax=Mycena alexandri TaxID=1745969 RepID=A0AAD6SGH6_9AGAR|nr:hypothetical protein C8F04DRAFT_1189366 [Mycena alexandri]